MDITIRPATDHDDLPPLIAAAFAPKAFSDGTEPQLPAQLAAEGALTLSLVAEAGSTLAGQITVSPADLDNDKGWHAIGPISVHPDLQGQGIGSALMQAAIEEMRAQGSQGIVLVGDPRYYTRFGFRNDIGLRCGEIPEANVMGLGLLAAPSEGEIRFHPVFGAH